MMQWVRANAGLRFEFPELPQFSREEAELFKTQITERREYLAEKKKKKQEEGGEEEEAEL